MMEGLAFLPVPDLTNGIHLLRTLCPDDPPEAAELLDYFDSTTSMVDLDNRIQHKIKQPFGTYMMPQSTVMPEPTTCARAGTTSSSTW
jgi:hypothetical protein